MTTAEFVAAQRLLDLTDDELAGELGVTPAVVRAWATGRIAIPRPYARDIAFRAALAERTAALKASGLPECPWMLADESTPFPDDADEIVRRAKAVESHMEACDTCQAHVRFEDEHFGPLPPPPETGWMRMLGWLEHVPAWGRPAVVGAVILAAIVSIRLVFAIPQLVRRPALLGELLLAVVAAAGAGAFGGLAYSLTRPTLRTLGTVGAYLTGIVCVFAYMGALVVVGPFAFGEPLVESREELVVFAIVSLVFGLVMGHSWFRDPEIM